MAVQITADMIKQLRERTGVGMGKCKEALEEAKGDMELAISNLRKAGIASAVKKEGRAANEGTIAIGQNTKTIALIEVNAETDFVAKNERFQEFSRNIANEVATTNPATIDALKSQKYSKEPGLSIEEYRATVVQTIGENIQLRRLKTFAKAPNKSIGVYSHLGGKLVTLVEITGSNTEEALAKDIAMHIAAAQPDYLSEKDIPETVIAHEREIAKSQIKGKPDNIVGKIVDGKIEAFYNQVCLTRQEYIKDHSLRIADVINNQAKATGKPLAITGFIRWNVGQ